MVSIDAVFILLGYIFLIYICRMKEKEHEWVDGDSNCKILTDSQIETLESFMVSHNLKLSKKDVSKAAKSLKIPVKSALVYFQNVQRELVNGGFGTNKDLLNQVRRIYKKIKRLHREYSRSNAQGSNMQ